MTPGEGSLVESRGWRDGARLLRGRIASIPGLLRSHLERPGDPLPLEPGAIRRWQTTGVGSSAAHARFLAHWLADREGVDARFTTTGSLAAGPPRGAERDGLVVFSQGLSPNARFALAHASRWHQVVLVTAVRPNAAEPESAAAGFLARCQKQGVATVSLPEAADAEYQTLVRVIGPALGYATAISLARQLVPPPTGGGGVPLALPAVAPERLCASWQAATPALSRVIPPSESLAAMFGRETVLLAAGGYGELIQNLRGKLLEGMGLPQPPLWDLLEFAHGGFQRIYGREATLLFLSGGEGASDFEAPLLERLRAVLQPERHDLRVLSAELPSPWSVLEHEAAFNELMLRWLEQSERDPRRWPGRGEDGPLYRLAPAAMPAVEATGGDRAESALAWSALDLRSWPEVAEALAAGRRSAVIPLGSTEQHGPHLPFATDSWIADALAERFCRRVSQAIRLPALTLGCASEHMGFPGTLSLSAETLERVLSDLLVALRTHGFERAFLFSAHGGNLAAMRSMRGRLIRAAEPLRVIVYDELDPLVARWHEASAAFGVSPEESGHHAGEFETSIVAALRPQAVRWSQLEGPAGAALVAGSANPASSPADPQQLFYPSLRDHAPLGVVGDPRAAQAARAERYLELWVDALQERYLADTRLR